MTPDQYAMYARVFDAYATLPPSERFGLSIRSSTAGAALRTWAASRRIDVVPETCDGERTTWTVLRAELPGDFHPSVSVSLEDDIPTATAPIERSIAELAAGLDIPF